MTEPDYDKYPVSCPDGCGVERGYPCREECPMDDVYKEQS